MTRSGFRGRPHYISIWGLSLWATQYWHPCYHGMPSDEASVQVHGALQRDCW